MRGKKKLNLVGFLVCNCPNNISDTFKHVDFGFEKRWGKIWIMKRADFILEAMGPKDT